MVMVLEVVAALGVVDRVDQVKGSIFGVRRKSFPAAAAVTSDSGVMVEMSDDMAARVRETEARDGDGFRGGGGAWCGGSSRSGEGEYFWGSPKKFSSGGGGYPRRRLLPAAAAVTGGDDGGRRVVAPVGREERGCCVCVS
nr:hypothetical protein [Tanacetum cinerariifolium]